MYCIAHMGPYTLNSTLIDPLQEPETRTPKPLNSTLIDPLKEPETLTPYTVYEPGFLACPYFDTIRRVWISSLPRIFRLL